MNKEINKRYVLVTVTNEEQEIIAFNYFIDNENRYKDTETILNGEEIAITTYTEEEHNDWFNVVNLLLDSDYAKLMTNLDYSIEYNV